MHHPNRPYVIWRQSFAGDVRKGRSTIAEARKMAAQFGVDMVRRNVPRSSVTSPGGSTTEFRYVDPRPGAPANITPTAQEN